MLPFLTYTRFYTIEDAGPLIELLKREQIPYQVEHEVNQLEPVYIGQSFDPMVVIKIPQDQFSKLSFLLGDSTLQTSDSISEDYYLFSFSDEELIEVIKQPEEWNALDRSLAQKILNERKVPLPIISPVSIQSKYEAERLETKWIILGYLLAWFTLPGIFFGLAIVYGKRTLRNGERVHLYDLRTIKHGHNMVIVGGISTAIFLLRIFL